MLVLFINENLVLMIFLNKFQKQRNVMILFLKNVFYVSHHHHFNKINVEKNESYCVICYNLIIENVC